MVKNKGTLCLTLRPITDVPFGELGSQKRSLMHYSTLLQFLWVLQAGLECVFSFFIKLGCTPASLSLGTWLVLLLKPYMVVYFGTHVGYTGLVCFPLEPAGCIRGGEFSSFLYAYVCPFLGATPGFVFLKSWSLTDRLPSAILLKNLLYCLHCLHWKYAHI